MSLECIADNIPPGYKQTELGVIPEDWDIKSIGEAFEVHNHLRIPISQTVREKMIGKYPYYGPTGIQGYINEYRIAGNYVLIGEDGDHFLKWQKMPMTLLVSGKFNVNNHAHVVKGTNNLTSWFYYYFSHTDLTQHLTRQGSGRYKLTKKALLNIQCILPSLLEQEAIVEVLSDADALIESLEQLITKKRQIKQGAMQELLTGKTRLTRFTKKASYQHTNIEVTPEDWEVKHLGEVAKIITGNTPPTQDPTYYGDEFMFVSPADLGFSKYISHTEKMLSKKGFLISRPFPAGSILFVCIGSTIGKCGIASEILTSNQQINAILPSEYILCDYLYYAVSSVSSKVKSLAGEQAVPIVNKTQFSETAILFPISKVEQETIATILSDMDSEITALEEKLAKACQIKQGIMQELLTGRIRLV